MTGDDGGPTLREYLEVRFDLMQDTFTKQARRYDEVLAERDIRYQQRFDATEKLVNLGFESAEKAITKAESATEKRFEGVNEFRAQLDAQQRTFMPRAEVQVMESAALNRLTQLEKQIDTLLAERKGAFTGWGYAVGVVGFILTVLSVGVLIYSAVK